MEQSVHEQQKGGMSKKTIAIIIGLLLIIGGTVAAYVLLDKSTKEQYFTAEKDTIDFISERLTDKFELETDWAEKTLENANRAEHRLQLAYDSAMGGGQYGGIDPLDIISNFSLKFDIERDPTEYEASMAIGAELGNFDIGNIGLSLAEHDLFIELPFTQDIIHLSDSDLNRFLHEADPTMFPEEGVIDFTDFFHYFSAVMDEEDMDYLTDEYVKYVYELLPESAFTEESESITVLGEDIKANRITFHLTEKEIKDILVDIFSKLADDEKVRDIYRDSLEAQMFASQALVYSTHQNLDDMIDEIMDEFDAGLQTAKDEVDSIYIPDGLTSTIWVDNNLIVKRDFLLTVGPDDVDFITFDVQGEHLLTKENQEIDIALTFDDGYTDFTVDIIGDFSWDGKQGDDYVSIRAEDGEIIYEATEELTSKSKKEFTRSLIMNDNYSEDVGLEWSGEATYEDDQMNSSHQFTFIDDSDPDTITINVDKQGSIIKEVSIPNKSDAVLLGEMELFEIEMYIDKLAGEFEQWVNGIMGGGGLFGF